MSVSYVAMYPADFLAGVGHLRSAELGAYLRLLLAYYREGGPLPADEASVAAIAMADSEADRAAAATVAKEFFVAFADVDGRRLMRHKRADRELARAARASELASARWRRVPGHIKTASAASRRAAKLDATPPWLTREHRLEIGSIYRTARELGERTGTAYHVDHIVPLRGRGVCGLHVPWNLRPMPATENRRKSNFWGCGPADDGAHTHGAQANGGHRNA